MHAHIIKLLAEGTNRISSMQAGNVDSGGRMFESRWRNSLAILTVFPPAEHW